MNTTMRKFQTAAVLAFAAVPFVLCAGDAKKEGEKGKDRHEARGVGMGDVRKADANSDGVVTKDEFLAMVQESVFARLDGNSDGQIDATEFEQLDRLREMARERMDRFEGIRPEDRRPEGIPPAGGPPAGVPPGPPEIGPDGVTPKAPRPELRERYRDSSLTPFQQNLEISQRIMETLDANNDGKIGKDEAPERLLAVFEKLDTNKDGILDSNDAGIAKNMKDRDRERRADFGKMLDKLDADGDGKIQKSEAPEKIQERFEQIDANGDGGLDKSELEAMRPDGLPGRPGKFSPRTKSSTDEPAPATAPATAPAPAADEKPTA